MIKTMKIKNFGVLHRWILAITLIMPTLFLPFEEVKAAEFCSDQYYINQTLANGSCLKKYLLQAKRWCA